MKVPVDECSLSGRILTTTQLRDGFAGSSYVDYKPHRGRRFVVLVLGEVQARPPDGDFPSRAEMLRMGGAEEPKT